jgi:hypothetical protein
MSGDLTTVFSDVRAEVAHLLRNRLAEAGIEAFVDNEATTAGWGFPMRRSLALRIALAAFGVPIGSTQFVRVAVATKDASAAKEVVVQFEEEKLMGSFPMDEREHDHDATSEPDADFVLKLDHCPECGRPRMAVCPVCQTARADFPSADPPPGSDRAEPAAHDRLLVCTTCDEPFAPGYLARCEWCGHDFGTGIRPADSVKSKAMDPHVVAAVLGISASALAILAYFAVLLSR